MPALANPAPGPESVMHRKRGTPMPQGGREGLNMPPARIYLDHGASTPCDPAVAALMQRVAVQEFANPSSVHQAGRHAARYIETAREQLAAAIGVLPEEIVFTSGATESNNLAILGVAAMAAERNPSRWRRCSPAGRSISMPSMPRSGRTPCCVPSRAPATRSEPFSTSRPRPVSPTSAAPSSIATRPRPWARSPSMPKRSASTSSPSASTSATCPRASAPCGCAAVQRTRRSSPLLRRRPRTRIASRYLQHRGDRGLRRSRPPPGAGSLHGVGLPLRDAGALPRPARHRPRPRPGAKHPANRTRPRNHPRRGGARRPPHQPSGAPVAKDGTLSKGHATPPRISLPWQY